MCVCVCPLGVVCVPCTYIYLTQYDINHTADDNNKVKHVPRISKITLWVKRLSSSECVCVFITKQRLFTTQIIVIIEYVCEMRGKKTIYR